MRCHPYLLDEINAVAVADAEGREAALAKFDEAMRRHIPHIIANKMRATAYALSRGWLARGTGGGLIKKHSRTIEHLSAAFAFLADVTLFILGGDLKRQGDVVGPFCRCFEQSLSRLRRAEKIQGLRRAVGRGAAGGLGLSLCAVRSPAGPRRHFAQLPVADAGEINAGQHFRRRPVFAKAKTMRFPGRYRHYCRPPGRCASA